MSTRPDYAPKTGDIAGALANEINTYPVGLTVVGDPIADDGARKPHPIMIKVAPGLHRIALGRAAEAQLNADKPVTSGAVVALPSWAWVAATTNVGERKKATLLPARIQWDVPQVIVTTVPMTARWRIDSLGHTASGVMRIRPLDGPSRTVPTNPASALPAAVGATQLSKARVTNLLRELVDDGTTGRWSVLTILEPEVQREVEQARHSLGFELNPNAEPPVPLFDKVEHAEVVSQLLFGDYGSDDQTSHILRLIDRCLQPDVFANVDPLRYITTTIHRDAFAISRQRVGDPKMGPNIRRLASEQGLSSVEEIVDAFRETHPHESLAATRVARALSAGSHISAVTIACEPATINSIASDKDARPAGKRQTKERS